MKQQKSTLSNLKIDKKGSLGLLALGDLGLRAWREVKRENINQGEDSEEKE